jgi:hypothetical protein
LARAKYRQDTHDDQYGPFVRVEFNNEINLRTPWTDYHAENNPTRVTNIIVPVYPKVRISYDDIVAIVLGLDATLTIFFNKNLKHDLVWDIKIHYSESYKLLINDSSLEDKQKLKKLDKNLPKFL